MSTRAPDFELRDQHGQAVRLSSMWEQKAVALLFYPFAFSGVCTGELAEVQAALPRLQSEAVQVLAVSCDPKYALRVFADRDGLSFPLLSDFWPHGEVARAFGVFDEQRGCARRSSFVLDRSGAIRWSVHQEMSRARDLSELLGAIGTFGAETDSRS